MLLFLDVDGTLLPYGAPDPYPVYEASVPRTAAGHPLLHRVDPALGPRLAALGCELVWATTWLDDANTCLAPWLGLPRLPVVDWPDEDGPSGPLHWKTRPPGGALWIMPGSRGLARTSAALSSVPDAPRRLPPPPCSCTHQTPLGPAGRRRRSRPA
ncbi:hypothetical protein ACFY0F_10195 [Streptomyces sp. NPDC001544]|uniref:hypothetical protein n=1 Tax=Streptomyces sp. NPDC001544 TaxID=3364584 RepID=UPI0036967D25